MQEHIVCECVCVCLVVCVWSGVSSGCSITHIEINVHFWSDGRRGVCRGIIEVPECELLKNSIEPYTDPTGKYIMCSLFLNVYFVYKLMC